ncbi:alpha-ribazole phosphatase [Parabacteroides provencensis]|uniref:alpha-ribazole phosphatase n=1 Tax=Parabacteroides provencensis TaxID=1944636 RepID=UPI000C1561EE|nr:alpha-ribazole phosphatase [Parabacteroides provencensis]
MEIYLIRHTSVDVPAGYAYGQTDVPLRQTFEEEATTVKENLTSLSFDKVYTSPLTRCTSLATYCGYPDAQREDRIKEINFGEWEMKSWEEISADPRSEAWFEDWENVRTPGGESFANQYRRVSAFIDEIREYGRERVAVFAHGGVLACAQVYAGKYKLSEAFKQMASYGEIIKLTFG